MAVAELVRADTRLKHKIFFALHPPADATARIVRMADGLSADGDLRGWRTPPERLHVSLNSLGAYAATPRALIDRACEVASAIQFPSFVLACDRVMSFGGGALVLTGDDGMIGADMLHDRIHAVLSDAGLLASGSRPFIPHLTLSWEDGPRTERFIDPIAWRVSELRLVDGVQGEGRHDILGRWSLAG